MNIIKAKDYNDMSRIAAQIIIAQVTLKPDSVLGLATGGTPVGTYKRLINAHHEGLDFSHCSTANLDEYAGLAADHPQSYAYFMRDNLFNHINIPATRLNIPNGLCSNPAAECARYERVIAGLGGVDLQLLGIGHNGHIGFNEPDDHFSTTTHHVALTDSTLKANARYFAEGETQPNHAFTMGIGTIMAARKILLIASGADKTDIMNKTLYGAVTPAVPASILQFHPDVTVVWSA